MATLTPRLHQAARYTGFLKQQARSQRKLVNLHRMLPKIFLVSRNYLEFIQVGETALMTGFFSRGPEFGFLTATSSGP